MSLNDLSSDGPLEQVGILDSIDNSICNTLNSGGGMSPLSPSPDDTFDIDDKERELFLETVPNVKLRKSFRERTSTCAKNKDRDIESTKILLSELKDMVKKLEVSEANTTPAVDLLERKMGNLEIECSELFPHVQKLISNFERIEDMINSIEEVRSNQERVEKSKWTTHTETLKLEHEKIATQLSSCLRSNDLVEERGRVDSKIKSLKKDLESESSDQMRLIRNLMGGEIGKVVDHVLNIKSSFDSAISIMKSRVEMLKEDFQEQKSIISVDKEEKTLMKKSMEDTQHRQELHDTLLKSMKQALTDLEAQHGADLTLVQQDFDDMNEFVQEVSERVDVNKVRTDEDIKSVNEKLDQTNHDLGERITTSIKANEVYADSVCHMMQQEMKSLMSKSQEEAKANRDGLAGTTEQMQSRLGDLENERRQDMHRLDIKFDDFLSLINKSNHDHEKALLNVRDDASANLERTSEAIMERMELMMEKKLKKAKEISDVEILELTNALTQTNEENHHLKDRILKLETRMNQSEKKNEVLYESLQNEAISRGAWQTRQDDATRNFRLQQDAHLHELEETLNEKLGNSRKDVNRLGRSNISLASLIQQCRMRLLQLATEEDVSMNYRAKLGAHCEAMANHAAKEESHACVEKHFLFSTEFQKYLCGSVQKIADSLACLADNDAMRQVVLRSEVADDETEFNSKVDETRERLSREFVSKVYGLVAGLHPSVHPVTLEARTKIFTKIELALKIAMSKHQAVSASHTLFGRHNVQACVACNRPMNKSASRLSGDKRAVANSTLPGSVNIGEKGVTSG